MEPEAGTAQTGDARADHPHRWRIAEPDGPVSVGRCLHCGEERQFRNWTADLFFPPRDDQPEAA